MPTGTGTVASHLDARRGVATSAAWDVQSRIPTLSFCSPRSASGMFDGPTLSSIHPLRSVACMFDGGRRFRPIIRVGEAWQNPTDTAVVVVVGREETTSFDGPISSPRGDINEASDDAHERDGQKDDERDGPTGKPVNIITVRAGIRLDVYGGYWRTTWLFGDLVHAKRVLSRSGASAPIEYKVLLGKVRDIGEWAGLYKNKNELR